MSDEKAESRISRKPSKHSCKFLRPTRMMKEGRMVSTKCCTAYIPGFEVDPERSVCELCAVPEMSVDPGRCRHFVPMDLRENSATRWRCARLGTKGIDARQCSPGRCSAFEAAEEGKWEIGKFAKPEEKDIGTGGTDRNRKLIPKSSLQGKGVKKYPGMP